MKNKTCYNDTGNFILSIKTDDIYKNIAENVKARCDASNYKFNRSLPRWKNKNVIGVMRDELVGKIMKEFFWLGAKLILT